MPPVYKVLLCLSVAAAMCVTPAHAGTETAKTFDENMCHFDDGPGEIYSYFHCKAWTESEKAIVMRYLQAVDKAVPRLMKKVHAIGPVRFLRTTSAAVSTCTTEPQTSTITFGDNFFQKHFIRGTNAKDVNAWKILQPLCFIADGTRAVSYSKNWIDFDRNASYSASKILKIDLYRRLSLAVWLNQEPFDRKHTFAKVADQLFDTQPSTIQFISLVNKADFAYGMGRVDEAEPIYLKANIIRPDEIFVLYRLSYCEALHHRWSQALQYSDKLSTRMHQIGFPTRDIFYLWYLGLRRSILGNLGKEVQAEQVGKEIKRIFPDAEKLLDDARPLE